MFADTKTAPVAIQPQFAEGELTDSANPWVMTLL
jgi:hypothetical protein